MRYSLGQILNLLILDEAAEEMSANQLSISLTSLLTWAGWGYPSTVCSSLFLFRVKLLDQRSICTRKIHSASMASVLLIKGKQKNKGWKSRKQLGVRVKQLLFKLDTVSGGGRFAWLQSLKSPPKFQSLPYSISQMTHSQKNLKV